MKPRMPARKSAPLYAQLIFEEFIRLLNDEMFFNSFTGNADNYFRFLKSQATHTIGSRGYPYFLACRAIEGKP